MGWEDKWRPPSGGAGGQRPPINIPEIKFPALPPINKWSIIVGLLALLLVWAATGFYKVGLNERGVVLLFGKFVNISSPGLNWFLPSPIGTVVKVRTEEIKRVEIGFRSTGRRGRFSNPNAYREESLMLTKSVNIIDIDMVVQYQVTDPVKYLFNVADVRRSLADRGLEVTVRQTAEAALREVVGRTEIDLLLTTAKSKAQESIRVLMQQILDKYGTGITVGLVQFQDVHPPQEVRDAFKDVNNAEEDKNRLIREAEGYLNSVIPVTRGKVSRIIKESEAYREQKIKRAEGDASRFLQKLKQYEKAKDVTRTRLYFERMESVLSQSRILIVNKDTAAKLMPFLQLGEGIPLAGKAGAMVVGGAK